ncbi:hypothetical protein M8818_005251 [Zalaria obscura]|uniref:Uncharacterized protein n=1 Tax=Zalaria obscura TaxID=2024903 RepID=A0ACC3SA34_9PEZI
MFSETLDVNVFSAFGSNAAVKTPDRQARQLPCYGSDASILKLPKGAQAYVAETPPLVNAFRSACGNSHDYSKPVWCVPHLS